MMRLRVRLANRRPRVARWLKRCALPALIAIAAPTARAGTPVQWNGGTGNWDDPTKWTLNLIPNNAGTTYDVAIANAADDVSLNLSAVVDTVSSNGILRFLDTFSLTAVQPGGFTNTGQVLVNHAGASGLFGNVTNDGFMWAQSGVLQLNGNVTNNATMWLGDGSLSGGSAGFTATASLRLNGAGEMYFFSSAAAAANQPALRVGALSTLTNGADHRIHGGSGRITGAGSLVNDGLIDADTPVRTLTIDTAGFLNTGNLWARSGNLVVNVTDWRNTGVVRVSGGGQSRFNGTLITNDAAGVIESVGGAKLDISQSLTNRGSVAANASGVVRVIGGSRRVVNLSTGTMRANGGRLGFESTNGLVQNFGSIEATQGEIRFAGGMDLFGGTINVADHSTLNVRTGTTTITQTRTTLDATSTVSATNRLTGNVTLTHNGILEINGGLVLAHSDAPGGAIFNINGRIRDANGTFRSDGGVLNINGAELEESGQLGLDLRNGGTMSFTNVTSTVGQMNVMWTGTGGSLSFNNYRGEVTPTLVDLTGWTADGGSLSVSGGTSLSGSGLAALGNNATMTVTGAGSALSIPDLAETRPGSLVNLALGGRLTVPNLVAHGDVTLGGGTFDGNLTLDTTSVLSIPNRTNTINGDFGWVGDRTVTITGSNTVLGINGSTTIAPGSGLSLRGNSSRFRGSGAVVNNGLIEGAAPNNNNSTFFDLALTNNPAGVVRASQNGIATNTLLQFTNTVNNAGLMEANGGNLYFTGATVTNSGTLRVVDHVDGGKLIFLAGAQLTDAGGTTTLDGATSSLEVSAAANVNLGTLSFTNGAGGFVSGTGSVLAATNSVAFDSASSFLVQSSGRFVAPGITMNGQLTLRGSGRVDAPIALGTSGRIVADSGQGIINGDVTVPRSGADFGRISLTQNSAHLFGSGTVTNSGLIEGGALSRNNSTFFDLALVNNADGVVRAFQNGTPTNTFMQIRGTFTNNGLMEAVGANLYFSGATGQNGGTLRAVDDAAVSKLIFLGGTRLSDAGGTTTIDGAQSVLEVSGAANVNLGALSFTNGGNGSLSGSGSVISATNNVPVPSGSTLSVTSSGRFVAPGLTLDGDLTLQTNGVIDAPVTVSPTGRVIANSGAGFLNGDVTTANDGAGGVGLLRIVANNASLSGTGKITNNGIIEGGATSRNNVTTINNELVNDPSGVIRAFSNGGVTGTTFRLNGDIVNRGLLQADGATLSLSGVFLDNTAGSLSAVNGGRVLVSSSFVGGSSGSRTTIDGDTSRLEVVTNSLVGFDMLDLTNGGDVTVSGLNSTLAILSPFSVPPSSVFTVAASARLQTSGITVNGSLAARGGTVLSDVHLGATGRIDATSSTTTIVGDVTTTALGSVINVTNSGTQLSIDGTLVNVPDATVQVNSNTTALSGTGLFTNGGLLEGGAFSNNNTVTISKELLNNGSVLARSFGGTNSTLRFTAPRMTNNGSMTASTANLSINGTTVDHAGTLRAQDGGVFTFAGRASVNNLGGGMTVDGDASRLQISSQSTVQLQSLALTNGGDVTVSGSTLQVSTPVTAGTNSVVAVESLSTFGAPSLLINGRMDAGRSTITAPTTIGATGLLNMTSSTAATFNAPLTIQTDGVGGNGRVTLLGNSFRLGGSGSITNSGIIEGGASSSNNTTFITNNITNNAGGVIRAIRNGTPTNTNLRLDGTILNNGLLEADGGNLVFNGSNLTHNGIVRAVSGATGGRVVFQGGSQVSNIGGTATFDGANSSLGVLAGSNVALGTMTFSGGAAGSVSGTNSRLAGDVTLNAGSTLAIASAGGFRATGGGLTNAGTLSVASGTTFTSDGPVINDVRGTLDFVAGASLNLLSSLANNGTLNLANNSMGVGGELNVGADGKLSATGGATINLGGDFVNASTQRTQFASSSLAMVLNASNNAADALRFEAGGKNVGAVLSGLTDNFGLLSLSLTGANEFVILTDDFDNAGDGLATPDAVYVSALTIVDPTSQLNLNGLDLYFGVFNGNAAQILLSGGTFMQVPGLSVAPEPATAMLLLVGFGWACLRRARPKRSQRA